MSLSLKSVGIVAGAWVGRLLLASAIALTAGAAMAAAEKQVEGSGITAPAGRAVGDVFRHQQQVDLVCEEPDFLACETVFSKVPVKRIRIVERVVCYALTDGNTGTVTEAYYYFGGETGAVYLDLGLQRMSRQNGIDTRWVFSQDGPFVVAGDIRPRVRIEATVTILSAYCTAMGSEEQVLP